MPSAGMVYVELSLDTSAYDRGWQKIHQSAISTSTSLEQNWRTLGSRSEAIFNAQRQAITNSFDMIRNYHGSTTNDIIRAEQAKAAKIKAVNEEQYGHHVSTLQKIKSNYLAVSASIAASIYAIQQVSQPFIDIFKKGFGAVEQYKMSIAESAAMVMTFSERPAGMTQADHWKMALAYATEMVPILENIAAKTLLSGRETIALANAFNREGVFLDAVNKKQTEGFTRLSNALPLMTQGSEIMRQINTEIRALMTGINAPSALLLRNLSTIDPLIEKHLKTWREQGTVLEHIGDLLVGFGPATSLLEKTWMAIKSTLDTTVTQILRGGMIPIYEEILNYIQGIDQFLKNHKNQLASGIAIGWSMVSNTVGTVWGVLRGFGPMAKDFGSAVAVVARGWGGVLAVMKPIGEFIGNSIALTYELIKVIGNAAVYIPAKIASGLRGMYIPGLFDMRDVGFGASIVADTALQEMKKSYAEVERLSTDNRKILVTGILDATVKYNDLSKAAAKAGEAHSYGFKPGKQPDLEVAKAAEKRRKAAQESAIEFAEIEMKIGQLGEKTTTSWAREQEETLKKAAEESEKEYGRIAELAEMAGLATSASWKRAQERDADTWDKAQAAYERSFGKGMVDATRQTAYSMQSTMSDVFFDALSGKCEDFADYWESFTNSLFRTFADMAAKMAAQELVGYDTVGGGRNWGLAGAGVNAIGGLFSSGSILGGVGNLVGSLVGGAGDLVSGAVDFVSGLFGGKKKHQEGIAYVPSTYPAIVHRGERILTSTQNQDFVAAMSSLVGGQIAQTGVDSQIAAALGQISVSTAATADNTAGTFAGIQGLSGSIQGMTGSMGSIVNNALSIAGGAVIALGTGNLGAGIAAGKGIHGLLTSFGIGPAPDPGGKATGLFGPYFDPNTLPSGYPQDPWGMFPGPSDPWGILGDIKGSRQEGGEVNVSGLYELHAPEVVYTGAQQKAFAGRLDRIEEAVASRPAVAPVFNININSEVLAGENVIGWLEENLYRINREGASPEMQTKAVALAGVKTT